MALTYLEIVNAVLRDTNEVPLTSTQFTNARGFHAFVKEAVNRALMDIVNASDEWPWLAEVPLDGELTAYSNMVPTDRKVATYEFPAGTMDVDWDTFIATDQRAKESQPLTPISYEQWQTYASSDVFSKREDDQLGFPKCIYKLKDNSGFGLSPIPDKEYHIQFVSWKSPSFLMTPNDTIPFPDRFYTVLVNRTRYYAWMFRENPQQAQQAFRDFQTGLERMRQTLIKPVVTVMGVR